MCPAPASKPCILIVDDEATIRRLLSKHLESHGFEVLTAEDGERALETLRADGDRIAIVILDMVMPRMSGLQVLVELRRTHPELPVLLSSGYNQDSERAAALGVQAFIAKPFALRDLTAQVRTLLDLDEA